LSHRTGSPLRPRILQLIDSFHCGGTERQAVQLTRLLQENGHFEVHAACLKREGVLWPELEALRLGEVPEYRLTTFYDINCFLQLLRLARYLKRMRIALIHSHDFYSNIFGMAAARLANIPARVASRRETGSAMRSARQRLIERRSFAIANAVVANCEFVGAQLFNEGVLRSKVVIVHNGLNLERFPESLAADRKSIAESLGIRHGARRLVTLVANLRSPAKDHPTFLKAALLIRAAVQDVAFAIAGEGQLAGSLHELAVQFGLRDDVLFIGRCDRIPELLAISDVCVLTSKAEGFPNVILEYMASSRPVVTTDVGGAGEAVIDGKTGFLVPVGNEAILAARVIYLLRNPIAAATMGELGRLRVAQSFSASAQLEKTERLYDSLLARVSRKAAGNCITSTEPHLSAAC